MKSFSPEIMTWSRETAGLTLEEAADRILPKGSTRSNALILRDYELGRVTPDRQIIKAMSKVYHRPLVTFYLSDIPKSGDIGIDMRSLPRGHSAEENARVGAVLRELRAAHSLLRDAIEGYAEQNQNFGRVASDDSIEAVLDGARKLLNTDRSSSKEGQGYSIAACVHTLESRGVFVMVQALFLEDRMPVGHNYLTVATVFDDLAPMILLNWSADVSNLATNLLHGAIHLAAGQSTYCSSIISSEDEPYRLAGDQLRNEMILDDRADIASDRLTPIDYRRSSLLNRTVRELMNNEELSTTKAAFIMDTHPSDVWDITKF